MIGFGFAVSVFDDRVVFRAGWRTVTVRLVGMIGALLLLFVPTVVFAVGAPSDEFPLGALLVTGGVVAFLAGAAAVALRARATLDAEGVTLVGWRRRSFGWDDVVGLAMRFDGNRGRPRTWGTSAVRPELVLVDGRRPGLPFPLGISHHGREIESYRDFTRIFRSGAERLSGAPLDVVEVVWQPE